MRVRRSGGTSRTVCAEALDRGAAEVNDLAPRQSRRPSRRQREERAYQLTLATGGAALATVVVIVLSIVGITSFGFAALLVLITAALGYWLKRTLGR
jgi:hypothetical protein